MNLCQLTNSAVEDIDQILQFLSREVSDGFAERVESQIFSTIQLIADHPGIGHLRQDLTDRPVHFFPAASYLIVYERKSPPLVHAVLHSARDIPSLFSKRTI